MDLSTIALDWFFILIEKLLSIEPINVAYSKSVLETIEKSKSVILLVHPLIISEIIDVARNGPSMDS